MSRQFERKLQRRIETEVGDRLFEATPSLHILVHQNGRKLGELTFGEAYEFYDLASLTKIIFTTSAFMRLVDQKRLKLTDRVGQYCPDLECRDLTILKLLSHVSGLPWWGPFYQQIPLNQHRDKRWAFLRTHLATIKPQPVEKAVYSDVDFMVLAYVLEAATGEPILKTWETMSSQLGLEAIHFNALNKPRFKRSLYAPTERCPWRGKVLRGEVHDDNAWALGGVAPHAGLFGTAREVAAWGLLLRRAALGGKGRALCRQERALAFTKRAIPTSVGDWGIGFMKPTRGAASCGRHFSTTSFGHTGFVGTSYWFDPQQDLQVVLLANRVHPSRANETFRSLRPLIHDWICESL